MVGPSEAHDARAVCDNAILTPPRHRAGACARAHRLPWRTGRVGVMSTPPSLPNTSGQPRSTAYLEIEIELTRDSLQAKRPVALQLAAVQRPPEAQQPPVAQ